MSFIVCAHVIRCKDEADRRPPLATSHLFPPPATFVPAIPTICSPLRSPILPCVTGHEIVGKVTKVGSKVTEFKTGDHVGVGAQVQSCGKCAQCTHHNEQYCQTKVFTYNSRYENGDRTSTLQSTL